MTEAGRAGRRMDDKVLHIGVLTPHPTAGPEAEFPTMAPGRVRTTVRRVRNETVVTSVTGAPPSPAAARVLTRPALLDDAGEKLAASSVEVIGYASTSTGYAIGFRDETAMVLRLSQRTGLPAAATSTSAVLALRALAIDRIALVSPPWFDDELNELGAAYFRSQGLDVVRAASVDLVRDPRRIDIAAVVDWITRQMAPNAEAVYIGGNGFRVAAAIDELENRIERPVLTANQVLLWSLLAHASATYHVRGYGQLFTRKPPSPI